MATVHAEDVQTKSLNKLELTVQKLDKERESNVTKSLSGIKEIVLTEDNLLILDDEVSQSSVGKIIQDARKLDQELPSGYPLILFLRTPGGDIDAGLQLIEFFQSINRPVNTVTLFAASMGFQIVQHSGTRYIMKYGELMSHQAAGGFRGSFSHGKSQFDSRYLHWLETIKLMDLKTVERTHGKQTLDSYQSAYEHELWRRGDDAVKEGYADEVVTVRCSKSISGVNSQVFDFMGMQIAVDFDKCPLITAPVGIHLMIFTNKDEFMELNKFLASGGRFGDACTKKDTAYQSSSYYFGSAYGDPIPAAAVTHDLCAKDKDLTYEKALQVLKEKKEELTNQKQGLDKDGNKMVIKGY